MNQTKWCNGPRHPPGGASVLLSEYTVNKSGVREGKPLSRCMTCRSSGNTTTVPSSVFMPLLETLLINRTIAEVVHLVKLSPEHVRELSSGKRKRIYKKTFLNISRAVSALPKEEKISIGPANKKIKLNGDFKLSYEERMSLKELVSAAQKDRFRIEKKLLRHVV